MRSSSIKSVIEAFYEQGFFILANVLEPGCVEAMRQACEAIVEKLAIQLLIRGQITHGFENEPLETRMIRLYEHHPGRYPDIFYREVHCAEFFGLFTHPHLLGITEALLGPEIRLYPGSSVRAKLPGEGSEVHWHQDFGSRHDDAFRLVNVWVPLVTVDQTSGCLQFIPGSHRQGVVPHRDWFLSQVHICDQYIQPVLDQAISIELDPGDVVVFDNLLFHHAVPNRSNRIRWSVVFRYQDATKPVHAAARGQGDLLHSEQYPERVVRTAEQWVKLAVASFDRGHGRM
jgi:phytanoyl-CoA hydroxylase